MEYLIEFVKYTGIAGVIALMWFIYHKTVSSQWNTILEQQTEREKKSYENLEKIISVQADTGKQNFEILKDMISINLLQNEKLQAIKDSIDNNNWCPLWRNIIKGVDISFEHRKEEVK